jgi:hypothetical protein
MTRGVMPANEAAVAGRRREGLAAAGAPSGPRVCMPTWRHFGRAAFQTTAYEAQDVLAETCDVDLIGLEPATGFGTRETWMRRLVWKDISDTLIFMNPGLRPVRLAKEYDLFIVYCQHNKELLYINGIKDWKARCRTSVCVLDEIWSGEIPQLKRYLRALDRFDHVIVGFEGSVRALSKAIGRPCHFVPPAVDALRFTPYPSPVPRVIDVYSLGRRQEAVHRQLVRIAAERGLFYLYDTLEGGGSAVRDYREHRGLFASIAKRSRAFMVAPAKADRPDETYGQVEVPNRYYEGAAAGAVLLGQRPECEYFGRLFDWPDAVVEVRPDGSDTVDVISALLAEPDRLREISRRNAEEAVRRHDWVHRWMEIFALTGCGPTPGMNAREARLRELADLAQRDLA